MVVNWAGDQFSMRPIMEYPPPIGQVSQVAQGRQMCGGEGAANDSRNLHVPHHHHCRASDERGESRVDNNDALYSSNKDYQMSLNGERGRGQWGVMHDAPHTPIRAVHDARNGPPDPYDGEYESYDDEHEGEGHDDSDNCDHEYERQVRSDGPRRGPAGGQLTHSPHMISRLGSEREEAVECPEDPPNPPLTHLPEYMVGRNLLDSGDPEDPPHPPLNHLPEYMVGPNLLDSGDLENRPDPPLVHAPEPPSALPSGAGEGTGADLDDDIHNHRVLRQPGNELAEDDDLPTCSIKGEGNGKPGPGSEIDCAVSSAEMFRDSGHVTAALSDTPAPQLPPNDIDVTNSGQGEESRVSTHRPTQGKSYADCLRNNEHSFPGPEAEQATAPTGVANAEPNDIDVTNSGQGEESRVSTHLSTQGKSYADCLRNNEHSFPGPEAEQATAPTGVANADSGPRSEAAGKELSSDAHDSDQYDVYAQGSGEDACGSDSYDERAECDFDDQGSGDADAESSDDEAEAYDVYDSDDYDDDLDPLHDGCESEIDDFEFSDSECGEESPTLSVVLQAEGTRTQNHT